MRWQVGSISWDIGWEYKSGYKLKEDKLEEDILEKAKSGYIESKLKSKSRVS